MVTQRFAARAGLVDSDDFDRRLGQQAPVHGQSERAVVLRDDIPLAGARVDDGSCYREIAELQRPADRGHMRAVVFPLLQRERISFEGNRRARGGIGGRARRPGCRSPGCRSPGYRSPGWFRRRHPARFLIARASGQAGGQYQA
ncbi:hypothetical protein OMP38_12405 [Cohnella ginsengisoli]|uniref:Uncharacterized protein n=1 Tax=Cohnella ginsengisoli TaxID=425004 RepID=A0A9X4KL16_9BACL|nr:hypothetical protein [Cohnella ginsengisoli]MDG0791580.1 hypothetical protein [Cohnella ginsengisoli]